MADLRATQIFNGFFSDSSTHNVYTVPTGKRLILKHVTVLEGSGSSCDAQIRETSQGTFFHWNLLAYGSAGDEASSSFWIVFGPGSIIQVKRSNTGVLGWTISGSLHTI